MSNKACGTGTAVGSVRRDALVVNGCAEASLVRAVGAGWSLVARTDSPAVLLLDTAPDIAVEFGGEVLLLGLLNAPTAAVSRAH